MQKKFVQEKQMTRIDNVGAYGLRRSKFNKEEKRICSITDVDATIFSLFLSCFAVVVAVRIVDADAMIVRDATVVTCSCGCF
jgi:hypothetical protein